MRSRCAARLFAWRILSIYSKSSAPESTSGRSFCLSATPAMCAFALSVHGALLYCFAHVLPLCSALARACTAMQRRFGLRMHCHASLPWLAHALPCIAALARACIARSADLARKYLPLNHRIPMRTKAFRSRIHHRERNAYHYALFRSIKYRACSCPARIRAASPVCAPWAARPATD